MKRYVTEYWLEFLLFLCALGSAETLHAYLLQTGSKDTWQLVVAIYASELVLCFAGMWGITGLIMATVMFSAGMYSVWTIYGDQTVGHGYFQLTVLLGTFANYGRHQFMASKLTAKLRTTVDNNVNVNSKGIVDMTPYVNCSVAELREKFKLSHRKAKELKQMISTKVPVSNQWLVDHRRDQSHGQPSP